MDPVQSRTPSTPPSPAEESSREPNRPTFVSYALLVLLILTPALVGTAITLKSQLDRATEDARAARTELAAQAERDATRQAQLAALKHDTADTQARVQEDAERLQALARSHQDMSAQLEAAGDAVGRLRSDLERFSERLDPGADAGSAALEVDGGNGRTSRDPTCAALVGELRSMRKAGRFEAVVEGASPALRVPSGVLFDGASEALRPDGRALLERIGGALARSRWDGPLTVAAYGDDAAVPGVSTWERTAVRAARVVELLRSQGVEPPTMAAAGYGSSARGGADPADAGGAVHGGIEIVLGPSGRCGREVRDDLRGD